MATTAAAAPTDKKNESLLTRRSTFLLIPNDVHEDRISRFYLEQMYGDNFTARIVQAIPVARLTDDAHVIVVARKRVKPCLKRVPDATGMPQEYEVPIEELVLDVEERKPVACRDFWLEDFDTGGKLNMAAFLETLKKSSQPFAVRQRTVPDEGPQIFLFHL